MEIRRGDIFYIKQGGGSSVGSEQESGRPAVIVSNDKNNKYSSTVEVIYFTTQPKTDLPTHVFINSCSKTSIALCEQITTVSKERIGDYKGHVTKFEMVNIEIAMLVSLDLYLPEPGSKMTANEMTADEMSQFEKIMKESDSKGLQPVDLSEYENRIKKSELQCAMFKQMYESLLDKLIAAR